MGVFERCSGEVQTCLASVGHGGDGVALGRGQLFASGFCDMVVMSITWDVGYCIKKYFVV